MQKDTGCVLRPSKVAKLSQPPKGKETTIRSDDNQQVRCLDPSNSNSGTESEDLEVDDFLETGVGTTILRTKRTYRSCNGKVIWTDNIKVDLDEVVQVEVLQENGPPRLGIMEGAILARNVWLLEPSRRIIVHLNEFDQPVRKGDLAFMHFLSDISRDGCYCPIGEVGWRHVVKHYKLQIVKIVREKFVLPDRIDIDERMLVYVNSKWKHYRWELHRDYYQPNVTKQRMIDNMPENVIKE